MALRQKVKKYLLVKSAKLLIYSILFTCRKKSSGQGKIDDLKNSDKPIIYIFWHRHIFYNIFKFRGTGARPLISYSPDGEMVSLVAEEFGMNPVRGSSSKGGARAFLNMINAIKKENSEIMITADGPKGPAEEVKDGTIHIARKTGAALIPVSWYSSRIKIFNKSWDRFLLPLPFGKIKFSYGDPVFIPPGISKDEYSKYKDLLKSKLNTLEHEIMLALGK